MPSSDSNPAEMSPGVPNEDEITADLNKANTRISSTSADTPTSLPSTISSQLTTPSYIERLEDMRDAITETGTYNTLCKHAGAANGVVSVAWSGIKRVAWVVGTSALILVIPLLYEIDKELGPAGDAAATVAGAAAAAASSSSGSGPAPSAPASGAVSSSS